MSGINKAIILGRLGKDPDVRSTQSGKKCATLSIATSEKYKDQEKTEWHRIVLWEKLAEIAEKYLKKGNLVYIEGKIQTREYDDKGTKKYVTEIIANQISLCGGSPTPKENSSVGQQEQTISDDVPF